MRERDRFSEGREKITSHSTFAAPPPNPFFFSFIPLLETALAEVRGAAVDGAGARDAAVVPTDDGC